MMGGKNHVKSKSFYDRICKYHNKDTGRKKNIIPGNEWNAYYKSIDAIINDYRVGHCTRYETMRLLSGHDEEITQYSPD